MKKAALVVSSVYQQNRIFDLSDVWLNRDNCCVPFSMLKEAFFRHGYDLSTHDINDCKDSECIIHIEIPRKALDDADSDRTFLLLFETELIVPENWNLAKHKYFHKIFTWHDEFIDHKKYFKMNWSYVFPDQIRFEPSEKDKFCCMIAGNKTANHKLELYSKRLEAIRWFEKHHPKLFDLFGIGWNEIRLPGFRFFEKLQILKFFKKIISIFSPKYPSYRGQVAIKNDTLKHYKYAICYENARDISGYITEKIFDCFFAGCIPIYWGANNITDHIPATCFIDKRKFATYEELFLFLSNITNDTYSEYIAAINCFLKDPAAQQFTAAHFAESIASEIIHGLK